MAKITRRNAMRTMVYGLAGAGAGFYVGKKVHEASPLTEIVDEVYGTTKAILTEVTGTAERKLMASVKDLRTYMGEIEQDAIALQKYWDKVGLMGEEQYAELSDVLDRAEFYVNESDFGERITRLKDRLSNRAIRVDQSIESKFPSPLRGLNEWFSKKVKGDERGSREVLGHYSNRVKSLVKVYDANQDNKVAQADVLRETSTYFEDTQNEVVALARKYLTEPGVDSEERKFYAEVIKMSERDPSGKAVADLMLDTQGYLISQELVTQLDGLQQRVHSTTQELSELQGLMDEGLVMKEQLRASNEKTLDRMQGEVSSYVTRTEEKIADLKQAGYEIELDLTPKLTKLRDKAKGLDKKVQQGFSAVGAGVGALAALKVKGFFDRRSERIVAKKREKELQKQRKENTKLKKALKEAKENSQNTYIISEDFHI